MKQSRNTPSYKSFFATIDDITTKRNENKLDEATTAKRIVAETKKFKKQYAL